jgi:hypothetical protein
MGSDIKVFQKPMDYSCNFFIPMPDLNMNIIGIINMPGLSEYQL